MIKPSVFIKPSGDLFGNSAVIKWLKKLCRNNFVVICTGGGTQISEEFANQGIATEFGPMGRIIRTLKGKQIARDILEDNQALWQDKLCDLCINATVVIPVMEIGGVLCHVNGDLMVLSAYNGFDKLYILTTKDRLAKKLAWLKQVEDTFSAIERGRLNKIEIVGF